MKTLLIAASLLLAVAFAQDKSVTSPYVEKYKTEILECAEESELFKGKEIGEIVELDMKSEDHHAVGCMKACVFKKINVIKDSKIDTDGVHAMIEAVHADHPEMQEKLKKGAEECISQVKDASDECDMSYDFVDCFVKHH